MRVKIGYLIIAFCLTTLHTVAQEISDANMKAILIYKFAMYTRWENEENIDKFRIGMYGKDEKLLSELKIMESVELRDKSFEVINFKNITDIDSVQILYVTPSNNIELKRINTLLAGKKTLLVSDQCNNEAIIMINFLPIEGKKVDFAVNKANIYYENLTVLPELLLLGGTEVDIAELYKESQRSLQELTDRVDFLSQKLEDQSNEIAKRNQTISNQKDEIAKQKNTIESDNEKILLQESTLNKLVEENTIQQEAVNAKIKELHEHEIEIEEQQKKIAEHKEILNNLNQEVKNNQTKIAQQESSLSSYQTKVERRNLVLFILFPFTILVLVLISFLHRAYRIVRQVNKKIFQQRDEILNQAKELYMANEEIGSANEALEHQKEELTATLENLKDTQSQLVQSAKMASLGKLTAGVAHELNNPINFINGNVSPLKRDIEEIYEIIEMYETIIIENKLEKNFDEVEQLKQKHNYQYLVEEINNLLERHS